MGGGGANWPAHEGGANYHRGSGPNPTEPKDGNRAGANIIHMNWGTLNILYFGRFLKIFPKFSFVSGVSGRF